MATLRDIKRRISGVKSTQQITKAMKMVAAARLRRAQENMLNARPYSKKIADLLRHLLAIEKDFDNLLIDSREVQKAAVIIVTSDRGLCGSFNMNIIRTAEELISNHLNNIFLAGNLELHCIGKKCHDHFVKRKYNVVSSNIGIMSHLNFDFVSKFMNSLINQFIDKEIDKVYIVYNEFKSVMQQKIVVKELLPIKFEVHDKEEIPNSEFIFEPDKKQILNSLLPRYLNSQFWRILLESYAAELGARMTAMDMASENAKELLRQLRLKYNKERQATITKEILEIVTGANALKKG